MNQLTLQNIAQEVVGLFHSDVTFKDTITMKDYHGFQKARIPLEDLENIVKKYSITTELLQVELVKVTQDLSDEIHIHHISQAYCIVFGDNEGLEPPKDAFVFINDHWSPVKQREAILITPKTKHGFTVKPGGILYFLSVQTPPIENKHGQDDYEKVFVDIAKP